MTDMDTSHVGVWTRRRFLTRSAALLGSAAAVPTALSDLLAQPVRQHIGMEANLYLYAHQSLANDWIEVTDGAYGVLGILSTSDPRRHHAALYALKRTHGFAGRSLRYSSTDRMKVSYAKAAIDYLLEGSDDLEYRALVLQASPRLRRLTTHRAGQNLRARVDAYDRLIKDKVVEAIEDSKDSILRLQPTTVDGASDAAFKVEMEKRFPRAVLSLVYTDLLHEDLLQLTDFLTGSVYRGLSRRGRSGGSKTNVKELLVQSLHERLDVRSLTDRTLQSEGKFMIVDFRRPRPVLPRRPRIPTREPVPRRGSP